MNQHRGVCYVFDYFLPDFSGHAICMKPIMQRLIARGIKISVICRNSDTATVRDTLGEIEIIRVSKTRSELLHSLNVLKAMVTLRDRFHCLHVIGFIDKYGILLAASRLLNKRIMMQAVLFGSDDGNSFLRVHTFGHLRLNLLKRNDALLAISMPLIESYRKLGFSEKKLIYIPQGVDTTYFHPVSIEEKLELRRSLGIDPEEKIVLFIGSIIKRKGVDLLIEAWKTVNKAVPKSRLILVGQYYFGENHFLSRTELNDFVHDIRKRIESASLAVSLVGFSENVVPWIQSSEIFVLPSRKEGFGSVIIEAMACGLPCVVTSMDGVAYETVENGVNGYVVENVSQLSARIIELLNDPQKANCFGKEGLIKVRTKFELESILERYITVYTNY